MLERGISAPSVSRSDIEKPLKQRKMNESVTGAYRWFTPRIFYRPRPSLRCVSGPLCQACFEKRPKKLDDPLYLVYTGKAST